MKYKLLNKALLSSLLLIGAGSANAGQTVKNFGLHQSNTISGRMVQLEWVDKNKQPLNGDYINPLSIEEGIPAQFYLANFSHADESGYAHTFATFNIINAANNGIESDIAVSGNHSPSSSAGGCKFSTDNVTITDPDGDYNTTGLFCPVKLTAGKDAPTGMQRKVFYANDLSQPSALDFAASVGEISVREFKESGTIEVVASDGRPNKISALAVSGNSQEDAIKIRFNIIGATGTSQAKLKFRSDNPAIADLASSNCNIHLNPQTGDGFCEVDLIPNAPGQTTIDLSGSTYDRKDGDVDLAYRTLPTVEVSIGSLYAGYVNGMIRRKNDSQELQKNASVRSLGVNAQNHSIYAISGTGVYKQLGSNDPLQMKPQATIGNEKNTLQVLTLSNKPNEVLVGNAFGEFYKVTESTTGLLSGNTQADKFNSIVSSYIDQIDNSVYFVDARNNLGVYKNNVLTKVSGLFPSDVREAKVAAYKNVVYVSANNGEINPAKQRGFIYKFVGNNKLELVDVESSSNPFVGAKITGLFFSDMDNNRADLYAAGSNGKIYKLNTLGFMPAWKLQADLNGIKHINDVVSDNLRNIYIAGDRKVWRIKHGESSVKELTNYTDSSSSAASLVVDPNEVSPASLPPAAASITKMWSQPKFKGIISHGAGESLPFEVEFTNVKRSSKSAITISNNNFKTTITKDECAKLMSHQSTCKVSGFVNVPALTSMVPISYRFDFTAKLPSANGAPEVTVYESGQYVQTFNKDAEPYDGTPKDSNLKLADLDNNKYGYTAYIDEVLLEGPESQPDIVRHDSYNVIKVKANNLDDNLLSQDVYIYASVRGGNQGYAMFAKNYPDPSLTALGVDRLRLRTNLSSPTQVYLNDNSATPVGQADKLTLNKNLPTGRYVATFYFIRNGNPVKIDLDWKK